MKNIEIKSIRNHQKVNSEEKNSSAEKPYKPKKLKRFFRFVFITAFIFIIGGAGGIFAERIFLPYLSTISYFNKYEFIKKSLDQTIIINKTEEMTISENSALVKAIRKIKPALAKIEIYYLTQSIDKKTKKKKIERYFAESVTGSILTNDGLIITRPSFPAAGDILGKKQLSGISYKIILSDGNEFQISNENIIKYNFGMSESDPKSKLIILKIEADNLPVVALTDSNFLEVGQRIGIIGGKITTGIISDFETVEIENLRNIVKSASWDIINIDAFLDENFSGAPVINLKGEIIGISAIEKSIAGIGLKPIQSIIPINDIKQFIDFGIKN